MNRKLITLAVVWAGLLVLVVWAGLLFFDTFFTREQTSAKPSSTMIQSEFKLLRNRNIAVLTGKHDARWNIQILIIRGAGEDAPRYSDYKVTAVDEKGQAIPVEQSYAPQEIYISSGSSSVGDYFAIPVKGQRIASIQVLRKGEECVFPVAESKEKKLRK